MIDCVGLATTVPIASDAGGVSDTSPTEESPDPAAATTVGDFLRRARLRDPDGYRQVLKKHPVNTNIERDEKPHELLTDFADSGDDDDRPQRLSVARQVDEMTYRRWLAQQF